MAKRYVVVYTVGASLATPQQQTKPNTTKMSTTFHNFLTKLIHHSGSSCKCEREQEGYVLDFQESRLHHLKQQQQQQQQPQAQQHHVEVVSVQQHSYSHQEVHHEKVSSHNAQTTSVSKGFSDIDSSSNSSAGVFNFESTVAALCEQEEKTPEQKQFEVMVGPPKRGTAVDIELLQTFKFGQQDDSFSTYDHNDLLNDMIFYKRRFKK